MGRWSGIAVLLFLFACSSKPPSPEGRNNLEGDPSPPADGSSPHEPTESVPIPVEPIPDPPKPVPFFPRRASPIAAENQRPGDTGWKLSRPTRALGAFVDRTSYQPGDAVSVFLSAPTATTASWQLWRMGYYGGKGGRKVLAGSGVRVPADVPPELDPALGTVRSRQPVACRFTLPADAVTGIYLLRVEADVGQSYAIFVVQEAKPAATTSVIVPFNTYQAYNSWGGTSLYVNQRSDFSGSHAYGASFDRPYSSGGGSSSFLSQGRGLISFLEAQGYDVAYQSDLDLEAGADALAGRSAVVIQAHSEYWTGGMRRAVDTAVARGTHLINLGANNAYWRVRLAPSSDGRPARVVVGYRDRGDLDPLGGTSESSFLFRDSRVRRPENALFGVMFGEWLFTARPLVVSDPTHWIWTGTGVEKGTTIAGVFGNEVDHRFDNGATPAGTIVLAESSVESYSAKLGRGEMTIFTAPSGATVFSAGSIDWTKGLADSGRWDPRLRQALANLFSRLLGDGTLGPKALASMAGPSGAVISYRAGAQVSTITRDLSAPAAIAFAPDGAAIVADGNRIVRVTSEGEVSVIAGSSTEGDNFGAGVVPASSARFRGPRGLAVSATGAIYVADTGNHQIRVIEHGQVSLVAGLDSESTRWGGFGDGIGRNAAFTQPMGLALTAQGTLLVADSWNHRIREVTPEGVVTTWAGTGALGISDGPGPSAQLSFPMSIAVRPDGSAVFVEADTGVLRSVAGTTEPTPSTPVNDPANPSAPAPSHPVTTIAGRVATYGWSDGTSGQLSETVAVIAGSGSCADRLFLLDGATSRVRELEGGELRTIAGGARGGTVDGPGESAGFGFPRAGAIAPDGSLWVVDAREHAVRRVTLPPPH